MQVHLRAQNVGGMDVMEVTQLFAAHGWVTSVTLGPELVSGAGGATAMVPCARVTFRTRTADDAAYSAMDAVDGAALHGGGRVFVDYAPSEPPPMPAQVAVLASATASCSLAAAPLEAAPPAAPLALQPGSAPHSGHASGQPSPLAGGASVFASPLRRGGAQPAPVPAHAAGAQPQPLQGQQPAAGCASGAGEASGYAPQPPQPVLATYAMPPPTAGYAQLPAAYAQAPPMPPQLPAPASEWQPGQSRLAYGTDQGRYLNEALSQRAAAGAGPNPYRAQRPSGH